MIRYQITFPAPFIFAHLEDFLKLNIDSMEPNVLFRFATGPYFVFGNVYSFNLAIIYLGNWLSEIGRALQCQSNHTPFMLY